MSVMEAIWWTWLGGWQAGLLLVQVALWREARFTRRVYEAWERDR